MINAIDLIGVPLDLGIKELSPKLGPDAFREIGLSAILRQAGLDVHDAGDIPQPILDSAHSNNDYHTATIAAYCKRSAEIATDSIRAGRVPVCLGGDHSLAIGSVTGVDGAPRKAVQFFLSRLSQESKGVMKLRKDVWMWRLFTEMVMRISGYSGRDGWAVAPRHNILEKAATAVSEALAAQAIRSCVKGDGR